MRNYNPFRSALYATVAAVATALPGAALAQTRTFTVQAQPAATGIAELGRQADTQILVSADDAAGKTTKAVLGTFTTEQAISLLLDGTGLLAQRTGPNAYSITAPPAGSPLSQLTSDDEGVPEILVVGRRNYSLNTGIKRTRDDAQPFVVFDQEQIRRTGSTSLEQFLSTQLTSNATQGTSELGANSGEGAARGILLGRSRVDLRGLGQRETLILIDGRRQPGLNNGSGELEQPVITNIPLASIERIEVLSSSASGLYGVGATGGVINVILRRNYQGGELTFKYNDTTDLKAPDRSVDLVLGTNIEGGRTNISFSGTIRGSDPLIFGEREDFILDGYRFGLANTPDAFPAPPLGTTPNIRSNNGGNLTLDPIFGGGSLGSNRTFVPVGFRGVRLDGVAGLVADAGQFNFDLADVGASIGGGARNELVVGTSLMSGTLAVRREMTSWLRAYVEVFGSRSKARSISSGVSEQLLLGANNPNNPFQQAIRVTLPIYGYDEVRESKIEQLRLVGGAIAKLGGDWSAALDVAYGKSAYNLVQRDRFPDQRTVARLSNGTFNPLVDGSQAPFSFDFVRSTLPTQDYNSDLLDIQFKIAGPLPINLPGGRPVVSLNLERSKQNYSEAFSVSNDATGASISYIPDRGEEIQSAYGEIRIPLIGDATNIPLVQELEITAAARYERYKGRGSGSPTGASFICFLAPDGFPAGVVDISACDPDTLVFQEERLTNSHIDPNVAVRWKVIPDLTFRASYATGYLPPRLNQLIREPTDRLAIAATDPERGNERIGTPFFDFLPDNLFIPGFRGGNPDVDNEESKSLTAGVILTPRFIPGLRLSADYTRIRKKNNYALPTSLLFTPETFAVFLELFPERITRGPASDGFAVGPITSVDASIINIAGTTVEAIDFAADYGFPLAGGTLDIAASATRTLESSSQIFPTSPVIDYVGVIPGFGTRAIFANGALKWRGTGSVNWSNERASIGWRGRYVDSYFLNLERVPVASQGSAKVRSQFEQDLFGSYRFDGDFTVRAGVNNLFNRRPPYFDTGYSRFGDPRLRNFYVNLSKAF